MKPKNRYTVSDFDTVTFNGQLLPQARHYVDAYQNQFQETHGWKPNINTVINEIIELWALHRKRENAPIMPGLSPGLYKTTTPFTIGDQVKVEGRSGLFINYLPCNKALVQFGEIQETVDLVEVVAG